MKYVLSSLFFLLLLNAKAQDCKTVNEFTSYHGIKIGYQFTDSLRKYCSLIDYNEIRGDSTYYLWGDYLRKYGRSSWLFFGGSFSDLSFNSLKDGRIYYFSLQESYRFKILSQ